MSCNSSRGRRDVRKDLSAQLVERPLLSRWLGGTRPSENHSRGGQDKCHPCARRWVRTLKQTVQCSARGSLVRVGGAGECRLRFEVSVH